MLIAWNAKCRRNVDMHKSKYRNIAILTLTILSWGSNIKLSYSYLGGFELKLQYQFQLFVQLAIHTFAIWDETPITNSAIKQFLPWRFGANSDPSFSFDCRICVHRFSTNRPASDFMMRFRQHSTPLLGFLSSLVGLHSSTYIRRIRRFLTSASPFIPDR